MSNSDSIVSEATASAEKSLLDGVPLSADIAAIIPSAKLGVEGEKEDAAEPEVDLEELSAEEREVLEAIERGDITLLADDEDPGPRGYDDL